MRGQWAPPKGQKANNQIPRPCATPPPPLAAAANPVGNTAPHATRSAQARGRASGCPASGRQGPTMLSCAFCPSDAQNLAVCLSGGCLRDGDHDRGVHGGGLSFCVLCEGVWGVGGGVGRGAGGCTGSAREQPLGAGPGQSKTFPGTLTPNPQRLCSPGGSLGGLDLFFLLRIALRDRPKGPPTANRRLPSTANRHQPPTATHRQPPAATNCSPRPSAYVEFR